MLLFTNLEKSMFSGAEAQFSEVVTNLSSTVAEFIPVLINIGLGIITATIGFVAIRWLLNWTQAKVRGTFS